MLPADASRRSAWLKRRSLGAPDKLKEYFTLINRRGAIISEDTGGTMIRPGRVDDAQAIARVHVDTWRTTYRGIVPDEFLANLDYARSAEKWAQLLGATEGKTRVFVAENECGEVVGFACGGPIREPLPGYDGELYAIYVLKAYQGRGIGRALVASVAGDLLGRGYRSLVIWVLRDNPSRGFYEALGGRMIAEKTTEIGGTEQVEVGYGWPDLASVSGECA